MKKILTFFCICIVLIFSVSHAEFYTSLPADIGSNSNIMKVLYPEDKRVISYSENYLISCMADPGTEITLYEKYDDNVWVPILINNEAVTGTVGESGLYLIDISFKLNSTNKIMFFAQKGNKFQSIFKTIVIQEGEEAPKIEYTVVDIQKFVMTIRNSVKE